MRFAATFALLGLAAAASAQSSASSASSALTSFTSSMMSSTSSAAASSSTSLTAEEMCLRNCGAGDVCCQAACVNVPCPSNLQANATTECAANCPQGNGSVSDTQRYASCQASCISSHFFSSGTPATSGTARSAAATGSAGATTTTGSSSHTGSGSASGASATASQNVAPEIRFGAAGAGLIGLIIAGLAL